jgi:exonuclease SbcD
MKLVHAADLHLDSPLRGALSRTDLSSARARVRTATRSALSNLVDLCIAERAGLLLIAGDVYDGDWRDYSTGLFFAHQMGRLREAGVQVVMIRGNHDAASQITKSLRLPDNVRELSAKRAESVCLDALGVAIHGQSFATRAVTQNLAQSYPERVSNLVNIGLLHTSVTGRSGHEPYAPCSLDDLRSKGYDYWALGHVHAHEVLSCEPWVVFPGNLQGRHARETGEKGAVLVEYDAAGIHSVELRSLDVVRYAQCTLDLSQVSHWDTALDQVKPLLERELAGAEGRVLGVRLRVVGRTPLHARLRADEEAFLRDVWIQVHDIADELWIEKLQLETSAESVALSDDGAIGELLQAIAAQRADAKLLTELAEELSELRSKLPPELREGEDGLRLEDPAFIARELEAVVATLTMRLSAAPQPSTESRRKHEVES